MNSKPKSITFFYPARQVGGAEFLFVRLAKHLSESGGVDVHIIDYRDGFMRSQAAGTKVGFIDYEEGRITHVDFPTYVIAAPSDLLRLRRELALHRESIVFLWVLHPHNLLELFPFFHSYQNRRVEIIHLLNHTLFVEDLRKIRGAIRYLQRRNALYFMDESCYSYDRRIFGLQGDEVKYLPITNLDKELEAPSEAVDRDTVNIGWLGRISAEKVYSLLNVIENADDYAARHQRAVVVHVIGEGPYMRLVKGYAKKSETLTIRLLGTKLGRDLDTYLISNVDVIFAMGTSSFEAAQLKIPTVLLGWSFRNVKRDYRYKWLYEAKGYSLGSHANDERNRYSFKDIMEDVYDRGKKGIIGERNYRHYVDNHSMTRVSGLLMDYLEADTVTLDDVAAETNIFENSRLLNAYYLAVRIKNGLKKLMKPQ